MLPTREAWLERAAELLLPIFPAGASYPAFKISVGWPASSGRGKHVRGECWQAGASADSSTAHVFISPTLTSAVTEVLPVTLHELIHVLTPGAKHRGEFVKLAKAVGLLAPWTTATVSEGLNTRLAELSTLLGAYPHVGLSKPQKEKQTTRLKLWECACGIKVRCAKLLEADCRRCKKQFQLREQRKGEQV